MMTDLESRVSRKLTLRIIPFVMLLYFVSFLDRVNVGFAALRRYEQARLLGGGSAINALMANRGAPADYDEWDTLGAQGWNWQACLPYFRKLETDCDFDGPDHRELHGAHGPLRIQRTAWPRIPPFVKAVLDTLKHDYPLREDQNGPWQDGTFIGSIAVSAQGERIPTSVCYLDDTVRARPNLTIRTDEIAERILFDRRRAVGARVLTLFFWVNKSYSRGRLKLRSASALDEPDVDFAMLSDARDLERLKLALRFGAKTLAAPTMAAHRDTLFPSSYSPRVAAVAVPGAWNALQRGALSALLDIAGPLRASLVRRVVTQGVTLDQLLADDTALTQFVTRSVGGTWHPS
ncbi:MAG: Oxidoreductase, GMC family [uncultured Paraburkholderia sp.]|nr:MAG: Oxidoreductase, GMC family [uncultured Paraburkholderia sp.]